MLGGGRFLGGGVWEILWWDVFVLRCKWRVRLGSWLLWCMSRVREALSELSFGAGEFEMWMEMMSW